MLSRGLVARRFTLPVFARRQLSSTAPRLSGHSKWAKIKHDKGAIDKARGVQYQKMVREIESAVRRGGGSTNPEMNTALANALKRAKVSGLPKENIENALKRAAGAAARGGQSITYEAMLAGKVPLLIECVTENTTRTHHTLRDIMNSHGAQKANVGFMFTRQGFAVVSGPASAEESLMSLAIDFDAEDVSPVPKEDGDESEESEWKVVLLPEKVDDFTTGVAGLGQALSVVESGVEQACSVTADEVEDSLDKLKELVEDLEEFGDVTQVWTVE
ncbi:YebC-like protein [Exidia glandulosa HHB12029]|uniref:YebC-like protein n=1 Tax=Exidia glandulosa HHB12029 TaxID=1314781 RepID=A0A165FE48_EXIGL|nr:YebC-like protein [Exidia glandulosa HHB12029]